MTRAMTRVRMAAALLAATMFFQTTGSADAEQRTYPGQREGDLVVQDFRLDFRLAGGEGLPQTKLHYTTLGTPHRGADGEIDDAVLVLHGTTGTGKSFLISTGQAVSAGDGIAARIREISAVATSIAAAVEEQGAATQEIVRNVAQAATGTEAVTGTIAGMAQAVEETGAAATQVLASATELSRQSEHLGSEVARFLDSVRAA